MILPSGGIARCRSASARAHGGTLDRGEVDFLRERFIAEARALARLPEQAALRAYAIYGKTNLTDRAWHSPTNAASRFFKVGVEMW